MERVIPLFYREIAAGRPITIFGPEKVLDFTYVDDCVRGVFAGCQKLLSGEVRNQTFNLAYGSGSPLRMVAETFEEVLGVKADVSFERARVGEVTHYVADISQARKLLGFEPSMELVDGLRAAAAWYGATVAKRTLCFALLACVAVAHSQRDNPLPASPKAGGYLSGQRGAGPVFAWPPPRCTCNFPGIYRPSA